MRMDYSEDFEVARETALRMASDFDREFTEPENDKQTRLVLGLDGDLVWMIFLHDLDRRRRTRRRASIQKRVQRFRQEGCIRWAALVQLRRGVPAGSLSSAGKVLLEEIGPPDSPDRIPALIVEITTPREFEVWAAFPFPDSDSRFGPFHRLNPEPADFRLPAIFHWLTHKETKEPCW
jgi:hypothetical protein